MLVVCNLFNESINVVWGNWDSYTHAFTLMHQQVFTSLAQVSFSEGNSCTQCCECKMFKLRFFKGLNNEKQEHKTHRHDFDT